MNYKFILVALFTLVLSVNVRAQEGALNNDENQVKILKTKIELLQKSIAKYTVTTKNQEQKIAILEQTIRENQNDNNSKLTELEAKTTTLLSDFSNKISNQEKQITTLNERLNTKNFDVYLYIAIALVLAIVLFIVFMKKAIANAITEQGKNWSEFLSYIAKR